MAAKQVVQNTSATLSVVPSQAVSSCAVSVFKPDGTALVSGATATVDSTSLSVLVAPTSDQPQRFRVSGTSLVVGKSYLITSADGPTSVFKVSSLEEQYVTVDQPISFDVAVGDTVKGVECSYSLSASHTGTRGLFNRAEFTLTPSSGDKTVMTQIFHITRMVFRDPVTADDVKRFLSYQFPSSANRYQPGELADIAKRASEQVMRYVEASGRFPNLVASSEIFRDAGVLSLKLCLADDGLIPNPQTVDVIEYTNTIRQHLNEAVRVALKSGWYDKNDDGSVDTGETGPFSTRVMM